MSSKSYFRKLLFKYCPSYLLQKVIREAVHINYEHNPDLEIKLAETKEELEGAFRALYRSYLGMGYCEKSESDMRVTLHHALPTTSVIIAKYKGQVVGTLTLVRNNNLKLPCEKHWNLDFLLKDDRRVAEITSLAIDKEFRRAKNGNIFFPILKFMYNFATEYFGTEILAIIIHPKERDFYEGLLQFQAVPQKIVDDYYGAPAMAMYLDLVKAKQQYIKIYDNKKTSKNVYHFFVHHTSKNIVLPKKKSFSVDYPVLTKDLFQYFFFDQTQIGRSISEEELLALLQHYPGRSELRSLSRFTVDIKATIIDPDTLDQQEVVIKNISSTGLRLISRPDPIVFLGAGKNYRIQFVHKDSLFEMMITNQWMKEKSQAGFTVKSNQLNWRRFLKSINFSYSASEDIIEVFTSEKNKKTS